jgi:hypothetical protein
VRSAAGLPWMGTNRDRRLLPINAVVYTWPFLGSSGGRPDCVVSRVIEVATDNQYFASARTVVSIVHTVLPSLEDMTGAVAEVEDIQSSIRLMALNTEIKTAHLGHEGVAMGVLASELHKITEQSEGDTRVILECLHAMEDVLKALGTHDAPSGDSMVMQSGCTEVKR